MTIAEQIKQLAAALVQWKPAGGRAEAATDMVHFLSILGLKPGNARVAILFNGETPRGDIEELARTDRSYLIGISRGRSFTLDAGAGLIGNTGAGEPLYDLVEQAREVVCALKFQDERIPYYRGIRRIEIDGYIIDAYQIEIVIGSQNPTHYV